MVVVRIPISVEKVTRLKFRRALRLRQFRRHADPSLPVADR